MKKYWLLLVMLAASVSSMAQTELYNKYSSHTEIKVACVNNMQLDSNSQIEVTILEAVDAKGWDWILKEFDIGPQSQDHRSIMFSMRDRQDPSKPAPVRNEKLESDNSCFIGVDFKNWILYVFAAKVGTPPDVLLKYLVSKMISQD